MHSSFYSVVDSELMIGRMYKTFFFLKTNNALSHLEKHSYFDLIELFLSRRIPTGHFSYQLLGNFGVFLKFNPGVCNMYFSFF